MFDYRQRPATPEYHANWDRMFKPQNVHVYGAMSDDLGPGCVVPGPELSPLDGDTGLPASLSRYVKELEAPAPAARPADDGLGCIRGTMVAVIGEVLLLIAGVFIYMGFHK